MSLFHPSSTKTDSDRPARRRRDQPPQPDKDAGPRPAARPPGLVPPPAGPVAAADGIRSVVDELVAGDEMRATQLVQTLTGRITARIVACRQALLGDWPEPLDAASAARLEPGEPDADALLARLTAELDATVALALLAEPDAAGTGSVSPLAVSLLHDPSASLQEAALDALFSRQALSRFDRICQTLCARQLSEALDRIPLTQESREDHRQRLTLVGMDAGTLPAPQHQDADEAAFLEQVRCGNHSGAIRLLAAAALVPVPSVEAAVSLRSRRGLVSLAWKAGYSMRAATLLQSQLAGIAPDTVLVATADGSCPIGRNEMVWQIGFLARKLG